MIKKMSTFLTKEEIKAIGGETLNFAALEYLPGSGLYVVLESTYSWSTFESVEGMTKGIWDQSFNYLFAALMATGGQQRGNVAFTNFAENWKKSYGKPTLAEVTASIAPFRARLDLVRPKVILDATGGLYDGLLQQHVEAAAKHFDIDYVLGIHPNAVDYDYHKEPFQKLITACRNAFSKM
jgi:hypothetical protein